MHSAASASVAIALFALLRGPSYVQANGPVVRKSSLRGELNAATFKNEVRDAASEVLGCGGQADEARLSRIEEALLPMWRSSPKSDTGRVAHGTLRYMAHRYFTKRSSLTVRGLESVGSAGASEWRAADALSRQVPAYVESVLASQHATEQNGFDLRDAALMVATLERLVFDAESHLLEQVYRRQAVHIPAGVPQSSLIVILEEYMLRWILADHVNDHNVGRLLSNREQTNRMFPQWSSVAEMAAGEIRALDFRKQRLTQRYSFEDAHEIVGSITHNFANYWQAECASMKDQLVAMDTHKTGRVPLSKFYGTGLEADWRFGESEAYLRDLGALDETSAWRGKQVIVANYIQAASNCIVSTPHYLVCCANDCESLLGEVEAGVGEPVGSPEDILKLVGNLTSSHLSLDDDDDAAPVLTASLRRQLDEIAAAHGGKVPIHGRLFAQWMHYAFPRECPFPHKAGAVASRTPSEFGEGYMASSAEMEGHASLAHQEQHPVDKEELQWMSQWSSEEELIADYGVHLRAPWERSLPTALLGACALALAALGGVVGFAKPSKGDCLLPSHHKAHMI